jgi:hypothetical protein
MTDITTPQPAAPVAGWYDDATNPGLQRWWDGVQWTERRQPIAQQPVQHMTGPATAASLNVKREVSYVRQQKGHSLIAHLFIGMFCLWINVIYISVSPNHYWHA